MNLTLPISKVKLSLYCLLLSMLLIAVLTICGKVSGFSAVVFMIWLPFSCVIWGWIYFKSFSLIELNVVTVESCLITGFWLTSLVLLFLAFFSPSFFVTIALFALWNGFAFYFLVHKPNLVYNLNLRWSNLGLLLIIGLAVSLWSQTGIIQKVITEDHITFLPWSDHFVHASIIQRLYDCSRLGIPQEFAMMAGIPAPMYHYGSYVVPSVLRAAVSDTPAINISTAFWLPLGAILSGLGAFVLGNSLWGKREGIVSAFVIVLLPDPFMYGCGLGYFSYHFLGQTGAALYYAEAIAAVGLSLVGKGIAAWNNRKILAGFIPLLSLVFFKAHVFIIIFPAACIWTILFFPSITKIRRALWMFGLFACSVITALVGSRLGYIAVGKPWALEFFRGIFSGASPHDPWLYAWLFRFTQKTMTICDDILVGTILLWFAALGPLLLIGAVLLVCLGAKKLMNFIDALPFLCIAAWTSLVLVMPANQYGNLDEFHHRPFHVVYYIFVIWLIGRSSSLLFDKQGDWRQKGQILGPKIRIAISLIPVLLLFVPWNFGKTVLNIGPCADRHQNFKIDNGLLEAAEFIKSHSKLSEIFLDSHEDKFMNAITGISERRPFLSEPYHRFVSRHASGSGLIEQRQRLHDELRRCDSECISRIAKAHDIRWYLMHPSHNLTWESNLDMKPVFESEGYRVFDLHMAPPACGRN